MALFQLQLYKHYRKLRLKNKGYAHAFYAAGNKFKNPHKQLDYSNLKKI